MIESITNIENIENLAYLFNIDYLAKYKKFYQMYHFHQLVELNNILPSHIKHSYENDIQKFIDDLEKKDKEKYRHIFSKHVRLNDSMSEYFIDYKVFNFFILKEKNETLNSLLKKFNKVDKKISFDFVNTSTGRLITKENCPNILTLPRKYRSVFSSRWKSDGELLMIDFKTLEPRIAKKFTSKETYNDIYEEINKLTEENLDRSVIKKAVISTLYGSHRSLDNISKEKTERLIKTCMQFFNYDTLMTMSDNIDEEGYRKNFFGRPIHNLKETRPHVIVNNYIQSTAVDVALMYFYDLINLVSNEKCKPIFIIHDAIVFDTHNSYKNEFVNIVKQGYNCDKLGYFPLELTNFMETTIE